MEVFKKEFANSLIFYILICVGYIEAAEDKRCRCVCPRLKTIATLNSSHLEIDGVDYSEKSVYIKKSVEPEACLCEEILESSLPRQTVGSINDLEGFCLRCECKFEQRNSTTQKVVIIFVIVVFGLMLIYGLFLMCLDPIMNKRRTHYTQRIDNFAEDIPADQPLPGVSNTQAGRKVTAAVNRVRAQQERWKGQVNEQRHNIYTKHKILA